MSKLLPILMLLVLTANSYCGDCPRFRGPDGDGQFDETGLLKKWPDDGPVLAWSVDGTEVQRGGTSFTLSDIFADRTVEVAFAQLQYTITASAGPNGSVSPLEADIHDGGNHKFTATAAFGYQVNRWFLDGTAVQFGGTTYEIGPVHSDHVIYVIFEKTLSYSLDTLDFDDEQEYEDSVVSNNPTM